MPEHDFPENADAAFGDASGFALTAAQQGVWIDWSIDPLRTNYNIAEYLEIRGQIDLTIFRAALDRVIAEAEPLHVRFVTEAEELRQVPVHGNDWPFTFVDMTSDPTPRASAEKWLEEYLAVPVDPLSGPLVACALLKVAPDTLFWCARYQHMVNDGFGVAMIARRFAHVYTAMIGGGDPGPSPFGTLAEVIAEDDEYRRSEHFARDRAYWKERLADCPEPVSLSRAQWLRSDRFIRRTAHVPFAKAQQLRQLAKSFGLTLPQLITVSTALYLNGMTGESDVVLGYTVAGRLGARASRLISVLSNVAPIRFSIDAKTPFAELAERAARSLREAMRRQRYRIADIRRDVGRIDRPLYGVQVNVMAFDYDMTFAGCRVIAHNLANGPVDDLSIAIYDRLIDDDVRIDFDANPQRYAAEEVEAHATRFVALLSNLVHADFESEPAKSIGHVPLVSLEDRQLLARWNDTAAEFPSETCLHQLIAEQVRRTPGAVAVVYEDTHLTYADLDARANQLAHHLRTLGVGPDVVVGLCFDRSLEMVIGLLAILKAGGAYLPLDPSNPADRLAFMLADAKSPAVVTRADLADRLLGSSAHVVRLDSDAAQISKHPATAPETGVEPHNLAYVIYTSGSTGKPKGAMNEHRGVVNRLCWMQDAYRLTPDDSVLQKTPFTFDVSVWEFLWTLMCGARLVMAKPEGHKDPSYLVEVICREAITTLHFVPSMLQAFLQDPDVERCSSIKRVICSGEALPGSSQAELFRHLGAELHNLYGPTEAAIDVTYWQCRRDDHSTSVPIGRPVWNTQIHILNETLKPVPIGVAGELYIAGVQVGRGYLGRPDLTAERFIPDPFAGPGRRMYRSGDIARWRADGALEYLGRIDHQVKIRGLRIELGEIEVALRQHTGLRDAAVMAREDIPGNKQLVAYLVAEPGAEEVPREELRALLGRTLPEYMVPATFVWMPVLPLTSSGKLDRKALPAPELESREGGDANYVAPGNEAEATLAGIWQEVLRLERVGITDRFFEIGGDSILSLLVISKAKRAGLRLTPNQIFQHQTIEALAAIAERTERPSETLEVVQGPVPLTAMQSWFFEHDFAEPHHWNQMITLAVAEGIGPELLQLALQALVDHHDALRLRFHRSEEGWRQVNLAPGERLMLTRIDLSQQDAAQRDDLVREAAAELNGGFDLSTGPLVRAASVDLGAGQPRQLLIAIHHLAVDGVSWRILLEDLQSACHQLRRGETVKLPPRTTSFKKWAEQVRDYAQSDAVRKEAEYWSRLPASNSQVMPRDLPSGNNTEGSAKIVSVTLNEEDTDRLLRQAPQAFRTQISDLLLAALGVTLGRWMSTPHIQIDLEGHGRDLMADSADLSRTVGWFTSIYPLRLDVSQASELTALLKTVKEQLRAVPNGGTAYGVLRYMARDGATRDGLGSMPGSEIAFNYLGQFDQVLASDVFASLQSFTASRSARARRPHLLVIDAIVAKGHLRLDWTYSDSVHHQQTIATLAQNYLTCLRQLIMHCTSGLVAGCTPSDFPEANLSQQELDRLVAQVGNVANIEAIYPQSSTQQGMLFAALFAPASGTDIEQAIFSMHGNLQVPALKRAWEEAMGRHDVLRTLFITASLDTPLQVVLRRAELPWEELDWRNGSEAQHAEWRQRLLEDDRRKGFDVGTAPLMRIVVIRLADDRYEMMWTHHHILLDGWSVSAILKEVGADYSARCAGKTVNFKRVPPYREFIAWLQRQHSAEAEAIWRPALKGFHAPTRLGMGGASNRVRATATHRVTLSADATTSIDSFARRHGLTLNTVVTAGWALLLSRASRQERVLFGASSSGRPTELDDVESMVGLFATPLPMPIHVTPQSEILPWLRALQDQLLALRKHQHASLADIQGWSEVSSSEPMFQSLVAFENYPLDESADENARWLGLDRAELVEQTNYPLVLTVVPLAEMLNIFTYDVDCFDSESIAKLASSFEAVLHAMVAAQDGSVSQLLEAIEVADARQQPAAGANRPGADAPAAAREPAALSLAGGGVRDARMDLSEAHTNIEYTLLKIVSRVLSVEKLGVRDDFFQRGMTSIAAVRIVNELNRALNLKLGVAALFRYRTVEQLAKGAVGWEQPVIIQMAAGKSGPPIYIINAGAHQFQVARFVGDGRRPVFGIEVPLQSSWCDAAKENRTDAMPDMDDLTAPYVEALRAHAGNSRCVLVGHCFAAVVAFETARRYEEAGGKVDTVILLDAPMPVQQVRVALRHWGRIWGLVEGGASDAGMAARVKGSLRILSWLIKEVVNRVQHGMRQRFAPVTLAGVRDENGKFVEVPILERIHGWVLRNYVRRPMKAPGLLVRAAALSESERPYREYDPTLGWSTSFAGGLSTVDAKGNHLSMIEDDENMAAMAREVNALLKTAGPGAFPGFEGEPQRLKAS